MKKLILVIALVAIIALGCITYSDILSRQEGMENQNLLSKTNIVKSENINVSKEETKNKAEDNGNQNKTVDILLTSDDTIKPNSAWCGIFQLIWNDLKNKLVKGDILFANQPKSVDNLNKCAFTTQDISDKNYYKTYGKATPALRKEIESGLKQKFNETSDILDTFVWNDFSEDYILYGMLKKDFKFDNEFEVLPNGYFGKQADVEYFGILPNEENAAINQVEVLYYESPDNFSVKLLAPEDEIIICKGSKKETFNEIYNEAIEKSKTYTGEKTLDKQIDSLMVPNIDFNVRETFYELEHKPIKFADGQEYEISNALQTIDFELDESGVKLKSEAGMMAVLTAVREPDTTKARHFDVDDTFTMFLVEKGKQKPYFAVNVEDITKFQENDDID